MCLPGLSGQEALERAEAGSGQERPALTQPGPETGEREELVTSEHIVSTASVTRHLTRVIRGWSVVTSMR